MSLMKIAGIAILSIAIISIVITSSSTTVKSHPGNEKRIELNDGTIIELGPSSTLSYNKFFHRFSPKVELVGEAWSKVKPASSLIVKTANGFANGDGGTFRVMSRRTTMEVFCEQGKVQTSNVDGEAKKELVGGHYVNYAGKSIRTSGAKKLNQMTSDKYYMFDSASLLYVLEAIESQYAIKFNTDGINTNRSFDGAVTREYQNVALSVVLRPLNINYDINGSEVTLSEKP